MSGKGVPVVPGFDEQWADLPPEERAVELMTSCRRLPGGRADAERLLEELRTQWSRQIQNLQRTAHDQSHSACRRSGARCHVERLIDLAGSVGRRKGHFPEEVLRLPKLREGEEG